MGEKANASEGAGVDAPAMSEADRRQVRVLMFVVIGLGVLLVAGLAVLVATVIMRASGSGGGKAAQAVEISLPVPRGAVVEEMVLNGNLLALQLMGVKGREVVVIDVRKGRVLRRLRLHERAD